jgi:hypothetical protein
MKSYNFLKYFIIAFLVFYFAAGLSTEVFLKGKQKEFIPLFSWFLFDHVPSERSNNRYAVLVLEFNGKKLSSPLLYDEAYGIVNEPQSPKARELIKRLGESIERGEDWQIQRLRSQLEQIYLPKAIRYQIAVINYQPLKRIKTGEFEKRVVGEFESL